MAAADGDMDAEVVAEAALEIATVSSECKCMARADIASVLLSHSPTSCSAVLTRTLSTRLSLVSILMTSVPSCPPAFQARSWKRKHRNEFGILNLCEAGIRGGGESYRDF